MKKSYQTPRVCCTLLLLEPLLVVSVPVSDEEVDEVYSRGKSGGPWSSGSRSEGSNRNPWKQ